MNADQQLALIRRGVSEWNAWRSTSSIKIELSGIKLKDLDLSGISLIGADLRGASFHNCNLSKANLFGANFEGATLFIVNMTAVNTEFYTAQKDVMINFNSTIMNSVDFTGAKLSGAKFAMSDILGGNFSGAKLENADFNGAKLGAAKFCDAWLTEASFERADVNNAEFSQAKLFDVVFRHTNLRWAKITDGYLSRADLRGAILNNATLKDIDISGVIWDTRQMRGKYLGIRGIESWHGNALFKRAAADQDFLDAIETRWRGSHREILFKMWGLLDFGRSMARVAAFGFGIAIFYGAIYSAYKDLLNFEGSANSWFTPFYFSIVTYTTLGFGDVRPKTALGEMLVCSEVIIGYITLGLLLAVLAEKLARRS